MEWVTPLNYMHQQGHTGCKTLLQQNPPISNLGCSPTQDDLFNGCRKVTVVLLIKN